MLIWLKNHLIYFLKFYIFYRNVLRPLKISMTRNSNPTKARHLISGSDPTQIMNLLASQAVGSSNHELVAVGLEDHLDEILSETVVISDPAGDLGPLREVEAEEILQTITGDHTEGDLDHTAGEKFFVLVYSVLTKNVGSYFQFFKDNFKISVLSSRDK